MGKAGLLILCFLNLTSFADEGADHAGGRQEYRTESGQTVYLPRLLTKDFYETEKVCKDARDKKRDFALVALKSHACDCGISCNFCLEETRNITDRANTLLFDNFATYHVRLARNSKLKDFGKELSLFDLETTPGARTVLEPWSEMVDTLTGKSRPGLLIVDTKACTGVGFIDMNDIPVMGKANEKQRETRARETNDLIVKALKKVRPITDSLRKITDDTRPPLDEKLVKLHPELSLKDYVDLLDEQLKKEDSQGAAFIRNQGNNESLFK